MTALRTALILAAAALPAAAQQGSENATGEGLPTLEALPIGDGASIRLDGRLDEPIWMDAEPITDFTQQEPVEGGTPSQRTEVRVVFDEDNLYISAILYDDPDGIVAHQMRRDAFLFTDDRFQWILDTFQDGRTGYFFEINPNGAMGDGLITGSRGGGFGGFGGGSFSGFGTERSWDGIWEARTARRPDGWTAEIRIPFRTLNFDPSLTEWGINFQRTVRRNNEEILWRGWRRNQGLTRPIHAGRLTGLQRFSQGLGIEALPYVVSNWRTVREETPDGVDYASSFPGDVGLDVGYSVTPSLRAAVSVNTDFAEVEVDRRRVNLTRFPLRFEERRDFFLEGSGVYSFAPSSGPQPYFSRRIGLEGGEQIPISYGARLGGQAGPFELGLLQVGTKDHSVGRVDEDGNVLEVPSEQFTVARVKRRILEQSTIGAIYTRRSAATNSFGTAFEDQHTAGVDLAFSTSHFLGDNNFDLEAFAVWNSNPDPDADRSIGDLSARGFRFNFPNDIWSGHLSYREFGDHYDPSVGFVTRNGFKRVEPRVSWRPRSSHPLIRRFDFSTQFRYLTNIETGVVEEREWQVGLFGIDFESGDNIDVQFTRTYELLTRHFEVSDGVVIVPGRYETNEIRVNGRTAGQRRVFWRGGVNIGQFWNGDRVRFDSNIDFRPTPGINVGFDVERNDVKMPQGDFTTHLFRIDGGWDLSPWTSIRGNVQFDDVSDIMGLFLLARWIITPGNDLFVVFQSNWRDFEADPLLGRPDGFVTLSRGGSVKLNYTYRW